MDWHFPWTRRGKMAKCHTCGKKIRIPEGWSLGPAVRKHYWTKHPDVMDKQRADRDADQAIGKKKRSRS